MIYPLDHPTQIVVHQLPTPIILPANRRQSSIV
jgi:hypothetical protein